MRAIFAHGAFDRDAAALGGAGACAYGVGLPAMALVRIVAVHLLCPPRHRDAVRATVTAMVCNIALKLVFVWGLHLGVAAWRWARRWAPGSMSRC